MSISAKPTEKVFKSLLAVTLSVSLCPLEEQPGQAVEGTLTMRPYGMATLKLAF